MKDQVRNRREEGSRRTRENIRAHVAAEKNEGFGYSINRREEFRRTRENIRTDAAAQETKHSVRKE
jgi:hypothetical protein